MPLWRFKAKNALIPDIRDKALLQKMNQGSGVIGHRLRRSDKYNVYYGAGETSLTATGQIPTKPKLTPLFLPRIVLS